jgi:hypothetical protein
MPIYQFLELLRFQPDIEPVVVDYVPFLVEKKGASLNSL